MRKLLRIVMILSAFTCTVALVSSCKKGYLNVDEYLNDMTNLDSVFASQTRLLQYINGIASYLPDEDKLWTTAWSPFQGASDENFTSWNDDRHAAIKFLLGEMTPYAANTYYNNYGTWYKGIAKANIVMARIDECPDLSITTKRQYLGEMYFFRGYFMYLLIQQYGPAVIPPDGIIDYGDDGESLSYERNSYDDCVNYIVENLETAAGYLPSTSEALSDVYRPTSGAALAIMSRVLLVAASPMYNGNQSYANWIRSDGAYFISQTNDNSKWGKAAVAAKRVMNTGLYELYTFPRSSDTDSLPSNVSSADFPNGAGNIDPYRSYKYGFIGEVQANSNPELIWGTKQNPTGSDSPLWISAPAGIGGGNGLNLTQDLIDAYKMKDGYDINNSSSAYPYPSASEVYQPIGTAKTYSDVQLTSNTAEMYLNREPRFYATIGFCHSYWKGTSYTSSSSYTNIEVTYYSDGNAAPTVNYPEDYNHTGYTCIKYNHHADNLYASSAIMAKTFPIIRYAEILLNYAEALNELESSYTDTETGITVTRDLTEIAAAVNRVRYRAGMPAMSSDELASEESIRAAIKLERKVEFACEGRRYHDLRRWLDAPTAYSASVTGMNIKAKSTERQAFYTKTTINNLLTTRNWSFKMYFWPIPKQVIDKNAKIVQNPSW
ncbi:MAG: RagB/SusD family nutrient uptake outer membrane protein [Niabella sp.]